MLLIDKQENGNQLYKLILIIGWLNLSHPMIKIKTKCHLL